MINATELERNVMQACLSWLDAKAAEARNNELYWVKDLGMPPLRVLADRDIYLSEVEWVITLARLTESGVDISWDFGENFDEYSFRHKGTKVFALGLKEERERYAAMIGINKDTNDEQEEEEVTRRKDPDAPKRRRGRPARGEVDKMRAAILEAWAGGEKSIDEIVDITGYTRSQVRDYIPETIDG